MSGYKSGLIVTGGDKWLRVVTAVTSGYKSALKVTGGDEWLRAVTSGYGRL